MGETNVDAIVRQGTAAIGAATTTDALAQVEIELFGKRSILANAHRSLGALDPDQRKEEGRRLHEARAALEGLLGARRTALAEAERAEFLVSDRLDLTKVIPSQW